MPETQILPDASQTPAPDSGSPVSALNMDSLLNKYLGTEDDSLGIATPEPKTPTRNRATETPVDQQDPAVTGADTDDDEAFGGVDTGDEVEEDEDPDAPPADAAEEDDELDALLAAGDEEDADLPASGKDTAKETFLPEFDRVKFLKEHPELEKPYKHMQAAFTRKMTETSKREKQAEAVKSQSEAMQAQMVAFQKTLEGDDTFEEFLVQVSLNRPEVMEKAYERAVALTEDEGKKKEYLREQELTDTKRRLKEREERDAAQNTQKRVAEVISLTKRVAERLGLTGNGDLEVAEQYVANQILQNHATSGTRDITPEQIVAAVRRAAKAMAGEKDLVRQTTRQQGRRENLKAAQDRARQPRRPAAPRPGAATARITPTQRTDNRPKKSALDSFIDESLGVEA